jgi:RND family efflux transporter MFP subunit
VWIIVGCVVLVAGVVASRSFARADQMASRDRITLARVEQGEFLVQVRGVGTLSPKNTQFLGANVEGQVSSIEVEAGAAVKKGDVLARMVNPKLSEQLSESQWELEALKKEQDANMASMHADRANLQAGLDTAKSVCGGLELKRVAEAKLLSRGVISEYLYALTRLSVEQQQQRVVAEQVKVRMAEVRMRAQVDANTARVEKMGNTLDIIRQQIADLTVRAPIDGMVEQMALKLGQQVVRGTEIGRIAPYDNLVALLDVQDYQARDIRLGQPVTIDTRGNLLPGRVTRIDPAVTNGTVKVEVAFNGPMPAGLRANQNVEGVIDVARERNALFVNRPPLVRGHETAAVYRLEGDTAVRVRVDFGLISTRDIEVVNGLKAGDQIVVSDVASWGDHARILLN